MGIETVVYVPNPDSKNYKPKIVEPGTYYCINYPRCKGRQEIFYHSSEIKPCPKCGSLAMFRQ